MIRTVTQWLQGPWIELFGGILLHSLWQFAVIAAAAALVLAMLRRASPHERYLVCYAALFLMIVLPAATAYRLWPAPADASPPNSAAIATLPALPDSAARSTSLAAARPPAVRGLDRAQPLLLTAVLGYLAGALFLFLRLLIGCFRVRLLRRAAASAGPTLQSTLGSLAKRLGLRRSVSLLESALVEVPAVVGVMRPVILFPASAITGLTPDQIAGLLAHELAHIRRHDCLLNLLQVFIENLLFYHPGVWWLSGRIRQEREHACDDLAAHITGNPLAYARALAQMESLRPGAHLSLAADSAPLLPRIRRLLNRRAPYPRGSTSPWLAIILPALLLLIFVYIAGCKGRETPSTTTSSTAPSGAGSSALSKTSSPEAASKANQPARERLEANVEALSADQMPFEKVIGELQRATGANIVVNWAALHAVGIERDRPVSFTFNKVPLRKVLQTILSLAFPADDRNNLGYAVEGNILFISTRDDLQAREQQVVKVFDIQELLAEPATDTSSPFSPESAPAKPPSPDRVEPTWRVQIKKDIIETIETTVDPASWRDHGGQIGTIREHEGQLIVNQTVANQTAVYNLLQQLRRARAPQIADEARLILVDDQTFKKLNLKKSNVFTDSELDPILKTIDSAPASVAVTAPRVALLNGEKGAIAITRQQNYIAGCKTRTDESGKIIPVYDVRSFVSGVTLDIEGTISADRNFVVTKVHPMVRQSEKLDSFPAPGTPDGPEFIIQKPVFRDSEMNAVAAIPDGQSLVVTGIVIHGSLESAIPGVDKHSEVDTETDHHLLIFIRPKIIVQPQ